MHNDEWRPTGWDAADVVELDGFESVKFKGELDPGAIEFAITRDGAPRAERRAPDGTLLSSIPIVNSGPNTLTIETGQRVRWPADLDEP